MRNNQDVDTVRSRTRGDHDGVNLIDDGDNLLRVRKDDFDKLLLILSMQ